MKKIFLLLGLSMLTICTWAKEVPSVIVHKANGAYWAWLNLYNEILYTPAGEDGTPARLDCTGSGFSACRVPNVNNLNYSTTQADNRRKTPTTAEQQAFANAINEILAYSEQMGEQGHRAGSTSKTVAIPSGTRGLNKVFHIKATWNYNQRGEGDISIYITENNTIFSIR